MDLLCLRCGEPWDFDLVLHELPEQFERQGCVISRCPSPKKNTVRRPTDGCLVFRLRDVTTMSRSPYS